VPQRAPGVTVHDAGINISTDGKAWVSIGTDTAPGATSVTLNATGYPRPPWHTGEVMVLSADGYGRAYDVAWFISW